MTAVPGTFPSSTELRRGIIELLGSRKPESSICPSDVARALGTSDGWRELMDPVRAAAGQLVDDGTVIITQGSATVDLDTVKGPIRIRRGPNWPSTDGPQH